MEQQTTGLSRNAIDKYYTKPEVVNECVSYAREHLCINDTDLIIEPSAGNGAFMEGIKSLSKNSVFLDIEPDNAEIMRQDYLEYSCDVLSDGIKIHVIGNPPFGRQSSSAIKFIKKSCEFSDSVSFILPKSFKKDSMKKSFPLKYHLVFECDLPNKSFMVSGEEYDVPCVFQIWVKKTYNRNVAEKLEPYQFQFVQKSDNPDISVRRVGVNAGTIDVNIQEKSVQSHYFIKFTNNLPIEHNILTLSVIAYEFNNTVGPKSISKQELIAKFNPILQEQSQNTHK